MLILAGVSINAIVGDNGVLTRTQYASFLNEMAAVEEAVQLWKTGESIEANGEETKLIPANGLCKANELTATERLVGEVGYYRTWSIGGTVPTTDILSDASTFNGNFESELIFYPAGVQDLYYLNNDALDIKEDKTYLIDAATGMIYSMTGIGLKGIRCYSSNMAKAVMNGDNTAPLFAEAEVSGTGSGEKLAGNVQDKYLEDGKENPDYNPYGFKIIASPSSNNIYKLYNNGDLYAKGVKGIGLNTSVQDMNKIDSTVFQKFKIPEGIGSVKKIIPGENGAIYFIDTNDGLWAYGNNVANKFGLTEEQQLSFTGREAIELNVDGKKVNKVFDTAANSLFVVTTDNKLYAAGYNVNAQLGLGNRDVIYKFTEVKEVIDPEHIYNINGSKNDGVFIWYNNAPSNIVQESDQWCSYNQFFWTGFSRWGFGRNKCWAKDGVYYF